MGREEETKVTMSSPGAAHQTPCGSHFRTTSWRVHFPCRGRLLVESAMKECVCRLIFIH